MKAIADPDNATKVLVARLDLLALAQRKLADGEVFQANTIRAGCIGQGEYVPVSRALAVRWGVIEEDGTT